jgi:demethylmenaquinone methyltransferase/2-methoxy-6-polyprenyl-1,4-benzoquinol methylase
LPGVFEVFANLLCPVSILINDDFPTFERPIKAYSGLSGLGQPSNVGLLIKYFAERISIAGLGVFLRIMQSEDQINPAAKVMPDSQSNLSKKEQVADMFNNIAGKYDFLNHFLSMGIDRGWRKKAIASIKTVSPKNILDVATGTGDLAIAASRLHPDKIIGVDIAGQMLEVGRGKILSQGLSGMIILQLADSEALPFADNSFDAITCAYGVRNFEHLEAGLKEMCRVMRPGGRLAILEFSNPKQFPVKQIFRFYFRYILPALGKMVSKHSRAYTYLPESVRAFPEGAVFCDTLSRCGFKEAGAHPLTFGITTLYTATK